MWKLPGSSIKVPLLPLSNLKFQPKVYSCVAGYLYLLIGLHTRDAGGDERLVNLHERVLVAGNVARHPLLDHHTERRAQRLGLWIV